MTLQLGIFLALLCALATNVGFLFKHRGAVAAPPVEWRRPVQSAVGLFRSKWFAVGMLVAVGAWCLHVGALAMAPLSLVQAVLAGGLAFLTVLAERFFGHKLGLRQWLGVGFTALGLVLLVVTLPGSGGSHSAYSLAAMISFESAMLGIGIFLVLSPQLGATEHHGVLLGTAAGLLFGVSDVAIKALTAAAGDMGVAGLLSPWLAVAAVASVIAFYASARGLQTGAAVPVITLTGVAANVSTIAGGIIVFGDPLANDAVGLVIQALAFVLVIVAAALTPAPVRAARVSSA